MPRDSHRKAAEPHKVAAHEHLVPMEQGGKHDHLRSASQIKAKRA